jgi:hypothetical protein
MQRCRWHKARPCRCLLHTCQAMRRSRLQRCPLLRGPRQSQTRSTARRRRCSGHLPRAAHRAAPLTSPVATLSLPRGLRCSHCPPLADQAPGSLQAQQHRPRRSPPTGILRTRIQAPRPPVRPRSLRRSLSSPTAPATCATRRSASRAALPRSRGATSLLRASPRACRRCSSMRTARTPRTAPTRARTSREQHRRA